MLASVVTHGGTTKTAQAALGELRLAYDLFEKAAKYGGRAVKFLVSGHRLHNSSSSLADISCVSVSALRPPP